MPTGLVRVANNVADLYHSGGGFALDIFRDAQSSAGFNGGVKDRSAPSAQERTPVHGMDIPVAAGRLTKIATCE